jgi:hypothetical protein
VNLQIHSWAEPNGYPGGGVLERAMMIKNRKPGDPNPFIDPRQGTNARRRPSRVRSAPSPARKKRQRAERNRLDTGHLTFRGEVAGSGT